MTAKLHKHRGRAKRNSIFARWSVRRMISSVALAAAIVLASGPNSNAAHTGQTAGNSTEVAAARPLAANSSVVDARLRAAAEPFETLTETAFSAPVPELRKRLTKAEEALQGVRPFLDREAASEMADHLSVLNAAASKADRALIALASIELYRVLVSSVSGKTKIPVSVSLMDYAGFRYSADLKADPTRWSDMRQGGDVRRAGMADACTRSCLARSCLRGGPNGRRNGERGRTQGYIDRSAVGESGTRTCRSARDTFRVPLRNFF